MTPHRRSVRAKGKRLPDQGATARAAIAIRMPTQGPPGKVQGALIGPRLRGHREWRPIAPPHAPIAQGPLVRAHSTPIAGAPGGAA